MPYNTTAIPPRKDPTGQTQLPLTRVKKIVAQDQDINICSNNAAFVITLATEMFIQHLTNEAHNMAKAEKKPRRNIQYKDFANAILRQDNLEFLEDVIPKTTTFKQVKSAAPVARARAAGGGKTSAAKPGQLQPQQLVDPESQDAGDDRAAGAPNGKRQKSLGIEESTTSPLAINGGAVLNGFGDGGSAGPARQLLNATDDEHGANAQLELEMRQATRDGDVDMTD